MTGLVVGATANSLLVIMLACTAAAVVGLGTAGIMSYWRDRHLIPILLMSALLWATPTFLIATSLQIVQGIIYSTTGFAVGAGYGAATPLQVLWTALALGVRPTVYLIQHGDGLLRDEAGRDHVRAANGRGLSRYQILARHVVRPAAAGLLAAWLNSSRAMIGSLPLVEFVFGYPGLGRSAVLALGVHYQNGSTGMFQPNLAVTLFVTLGILLLLLEAAARWLQRRIDPRVEELL